MDTHVEKMKKILKVHDSLVSVTNKLINKTNVYHEKQIQVLEKEIRVKDSMNLIMQQLLIKLIWYAHDFLDIPTFIKDGVTTHESKASNVDS